MIKNEEYIKLLKSMISCVNHGDYYSIKELSHLKLEQMEKEEKKINKEVKELIKKIKMKNLKNKNIEDLKKEDILIMFKLYSQYMSNLIENTNNIDELQDTTITVEEFIKKCAR